MIHYFFGSDGIRSGFLVNGGTVPTVDPAESCVSRETELPERAIKLSGTQILFGDVVEGEFELDEGETPIEIGG